MALQTRSSALKLILSQDSPLTVFQPITLGRVADQLSVLVVLHGLDTAVEVQVVPLAGSNRCGVRIQAKAAE